jgi:mitochondrial inner membrane protein COX18
MIIRPPALAARWPSSRPQLALPSRHRLQFTFSTRRHSPLETSRQYAHNTFQYVHDFSGLPWDISIPLTTILVRTFFSLITHYPLFLHQRRLNMSAPLREAYRNAESRRSNERARREGQAEKVNRRRTKLFFRSFTYNRYVAMLPIIYLPVWWHICPQALWEMFAADQLGPETTSAELSASVSSIASEGLLWLPDLTAFNPHLCLAYAGLAIANAVFGGIHDFRLHEPFSTPQFWQRARVNVFRTAAIVYPVLQTYLFFHAQVPAAIALFCVFSSLTALVTRSMIKRFVGTSKPLIEPARPRSIRLRKRVTHASGRPYYAGSALVPKEWDDVFMQRPN